MSPLMKLLVLFLFVITLICETAQAKPNKEDQSNEQQNYSDAKPIDYSKQIESIQSQISKLDSSVDAFKKNGQQISKLQSELSKISKV